ncbi:Sodium/hydrogen exchanger family protein [Paractinoplanes atraurantiacus]|uniref:Sodium/hydrogen exchanger family protein n=1 Tax=Paractinoplanes atraurantiacus TaxID=1036182 RepID=A0A285GNY5_9ACTN|nr:cation:proton antiporter [Actinoplanes atraurantiacus]SNY25267.1 Sodium/hydrogen exchanger family protein [Actinoplanes atraurantiacus]
MIATLVVIAAVTGAWSLVAGRLERWHVRAPLVMVVAGIVTAIFTDAFTDTVSSTVAQHVAEVILAVLLFVDATEVRGGRLFGDEPGLAARSLLIAMPLSLGLAVLIGWLLLPPSLSWAALLVIACIVVPIDLAPAESLVRDRLVPARVRELLNVESGYNDGIMSPVFLFALILAGTSSTADTPLEALAAAVPSAVKAILAGAGLGLLIAALMNLAERHGWTTGQSRRITVVAAPLLAYTATVAIGGNGFVAAFVCGIAFRYLRHVRPHHHVKHRAQTPDLQLLEDTAAMATIAMWFYLDRLRPARLQRPPGRRPRRDRPVHHDDHRHRQRPAARTGRGGGRPRPGPPPGITRSRVRVDVTDVNQSGTGATVPVVKGQHAQNAAVAGQQRVGIHGA